MEYRIISRVLTDHEKIRTLTSQINVEDATEIT